MNRAYKYSVIIPIYNAEKTLRRCVESLLKQGYDSAQILLINDGSVDNSDTICREYAARTENITYISKKNGGVSSARNAGLDVACGQYITFVDSDDYVCEDYFAQLDTILEQTNAQFIMFSHYVTDGKANYEHRLSNYHIRDSYIFYKKAEELIYKKRINAPWNKVFLRSKIEKYNIRFPEDISIGEDRFFNIHYITVCSSMYSCDRMLYIVSTENEDSLSRAARKDLQEQFDRLDKATDVMVSQADIAPEFRQQIRDALNFAVVRSVYSDTKRMYIAGKSRRERNAMIRRRCREINMMNLSLPTSRYCRLFAIPVRLRWAAAINAIVWCLLHR